MKKVKVRYSSIILNTTKEKVDQFDEYAELDDEGYYDIVEGERLDDATFFEPSGKFVERIQKRCYVDSKLIGYCDEFESNYKVPKDVQKNMYDYVEYEECAPRISYWSCFYDENEKRTQNKELIDKLIKCSEGEGDGTDWYSDTGLGISRFEDIDFLSEDYINLD